MGITIKNAKTLNPKGRLTDVDVRVENGKVDKIIFAENSGATLEPASGDQVIDAGGRLLLPGLIDMHVHFREPGFEYKETIATGTQAAARGGFTTVACMPNTRPVIDNAEILKAVYDKAKREGSVRLLSYACITKNELGRELTNFEVLAEAGAAGFTDDGVGVQSAQMMKDAMARARTVNRPIVAHCEDNTLVEGAPVAEGEFARRHGLKGIPNESEAIHVGRDILLAEATGAHYHVCHVSTEQSVRLIRQAKALGIRVTAEVCPHHLLLSEEDIPGLDANWKMNPPLRSRRDVEAMIEGLEDGTIDIIVTDHAPHSIEDKERGMQLAPFGIVGLETAFPLLYTKFVKTGKWSLDFLAERLTRKPAEVFQLPWGRLEEGGTADLTLIDLEREKEVHPREFRSKSVNTPFMGWKLCGWPTLTLSEGRIAWSES